LGGFMPNTASTPAKTSADTYFREYAYHDPQRSGRPNLQDTLLWSPRLLCSDGQVDVSFHLNQNQTSYRILVFANGPTGRLGFYEGRLEVRPGAKK
jgi:hypothetical protein